VYPRCYPSADSYCYRWGAGDIELFRKYAAELVALKPDVILATAGSIVGALQQESRTVPIVFVTTVDPVGGGWVESLARPGGNATGFTSYEFSMCGKRLELLKEMAPLTRRVAVIRDPRVPAGSPRTAEWRGSHLSRPPCGFKS
jgi:putative ABC transport system substrate-binding protein